MTQAQLWGGPEDGAELFIPPGDLPRLIGVHRTADGALVPIRGRNLNLELAHVCVYEHATPGMAHGTGLAWLQWLADDGRHPVYVHRDLVTRWTARP